MVHCPSGFAPWQNTDIPLNRDICLGIKCPLPPRSYSTEQGELSERWPGVRAIFSPLPPGTGFYLMPSASRCWPQWLRDVTHAWPGVATREWDSRDLQPGGPPRKATKDARPPTYSREGCLRTKARIFLKYSPSVVATRSGITRRPPPRPSEKNKRYVFLGGSLVLIYTGNNLNRCLRKGEHDLLTEKPFFFFFLLKMCRKPCRTSQCFS